MTKDKFGQYIYNENDLLDIVMRGIDTNNITILTTGINSNTIKVINRTSNNFNISKYTMSELSVSEFDKEKQKNWYMPVKYKELNIAQYILSLCSTQEELQRCGEELLMYQDRNLFNLLRYMKYLVDVMKENNIIWGVGRGSSVASYVLFKLEVHKINSMFYKLDVKDFLR